MRSIVHCLSALQVASLIFGATAINGSDGVPTANGDWQAQIFLRLEEQEYVPSQHADVLQAPNRAQNMRTYFRAGGIDVVPRQVNAKEAASWEFGWRTSAWGRAGQLASVNKAAAEPSTSGARVSYAYDGLDEWYENKKEGLEQGFTVYRRPAGQRPLVVSGRITGGLRPALSAAEGAIDLLDEHGARALRYGELHVWDASGEELASHLAVDGFDVAIVIEDDGANYPLTIDPLLTSPSWTAEGNQDTANFGYSVATAGDVNGDGFSDVIVGAWKYDNGESNEGRASVFLGSSNGIGLAPAWMAESNQANANFGASVASAGDVNGDGFFDVIVGATGFAATANNRGRAFVYLGSASGLASTPAWTADGGPAAELGRSVATAGDVNGDGFCDVIVGAWQSTNGAASEGQAFVYHGSASGLASTPSWTGDGNQAAAFYGCSVATAGDVNADGFADVIVGAFGYDSPLTDEGVAFVYHGSASGLSLTPSWTGEGNQSGANFGWSVSTAGDIDGDGYCDVIVGAISYDNAEVNEGGAFVYGGSPFGLGASPKATRESNQAFAEFGGSVATAGDVNGDGYADVIIGSDTYDAGQTNEGRAFVYQGTATGLATATAWTGESDQGGAFFGVSVATAGDVNGDGYSDVIVGAWQFDNGHTDEGRAFVYHGSASSLTTSIGWIRDGQQAGAQFGGSVASAGDVNGDGYSDVIVGANGYDNGQLGEGAAFVYHGSYFGPSLIPNWTGESNQEGANFGLSVSSAGDVNGDGYSDIIVGAYRFDNGQLNEGRAYVYHGSATGVATSPAWTVESDQDVSEFGSWVSTAGDVNSDGYSDVIIGANKYENGQEFEGRAFVYHGSEEGLATSPAWTAEGDQAFARFGYPVSTAGDVNGDGYSDVIIGAFAYDDGQGHIGKAFVYHGSPAGLETFPAWTAQADQNVDLFGSSVSTAGDVNGDGFSDVLIGAPNSSNGGETFAYYGSATGLSPNPDWTVESDQLVARFGKSVATAGDVNGDGYSDVIIGADHYSNGQANEGRAYVYRGSANGLIFTPDWITEGEQAQACFGQSVASAGDVNGDGFSDVIVGAWAFDDGQTTEGRTFVYYGNGGDGLDRIVRQARTDDTAPISMLGVSDSETGFLLKARGRTAAGRGNVRLQNEVKPFAVPFDGSGLATGDAFNSGIPNPTPGVGSVVPLSDLASGLVHHTLYRWRLRILSDSPFFPSSPWLTLAGNALTEADLRTFSVLTAVAEESPRVRVSLLRPCVPNPFTIETRLTYALPERGRARLAIYDVSGRKVAALVNEVHDAGPYSRSWDGRGAGGERVPSGVYFARLEFAGRVEAQKIVLTR